MAACCGATRPYPGWSVHQRSSSDMAANTPVQIAYDDLSIGNLMFFASKGGHNPSDVDHVGIYIGNDWMMHSTDDGPQLQYVGTGWYHDHFLWGRGLRFNGAPDIQQGSVLRQGENAVGPVA